jgi:hypothetical protein
MIAKWYTTEITKARCVADMQLIACNQINAKIMELQERILNLEILKEKVDEIVDWENYEQVTADTNEYGDDQSVSALKELGEYYYEMVHGGYFSQTKE